MGRDRMGRGRHQRFLVLARLARGGGYDFDFFLFMAASTSHKDGNGIWIFLFFLFFFLCGKRGVLGLGFGLGGHSIYMGVHEWMGTIYGWEARRGMRMRGGG